MNSIEQSIRAAAKSKAKELVADKRAYVESVGKCDIDTLGDTNHAGNTAIRLILGATTSMPYRALSYVESAACIALHFPEAQLQIVHANHLGNKINSIDSEASHAASMNLAKHTLSLLARIPELKGRIIHGTDTPHDTDQYVDAVRVMYENDPTIAARMQDKGVKHGGDSMRYVAAHFAFHDVDELEIATLFGCVQAEADRIISVGCQSERDFYAARMGMRACMDMSSLLPTAQIFTRHVTPPYYTARGGEPLLDENIADNVIGDTAAARDITHYRTLLKGEI